MRTILERDAHAESLGDARRVVDDLPGGPVELEAGREDVRVREVVQVPAHLAITSEQPEGPASLRIEEACEDRRRIEARQAKPLDGRRRRHQREDATVADAPMVERRHVKRRGGSGHVVLAGLAGLDGG